MFATLLSPVSALADTNLEIGGTAVIAYANGDDVRLREEPGYDGAVVRMVYEGAAVDVYDGPLEDSDGNLWYQVGFDGDSGYIISDYLALNGGAQADDSIFNPESESIGAALIAGTNNDGVRCRVGADPGAAVITVVPEGTIVEITGAAIDVWQPINCAGQGGYVHIDYVSWDLEGGSESAGESDAVIGEAFVAGTNGDGVRCRASASYDSSIITVLSEGSSVALRDVVRGDFQGVVCAGENGYAASMYLAADGSGGGDASGDDVVGEAFVSGTNGDGVRCRSSAGFDGSVITVLSEGTAVALRSGGSDGWQPVICAGSNGFISAEFLSSSSGGDDGGGEVTGDAVISGTNGDGVRCRAQASFSGDVLTVLSEGDGVSLRGDQDGDWVAVVCASENGWVHADYVGSGSGSNDGGSSGGGSNSNFSAGDRAVVSGTNGDGVRLRSSGSSDAAVISVLSEGTSVSVIDGSTGDWVAISVSGTSGFVHMDYLSSEATAGDDGSSDGGSLSSGDHAVTTSSLNLRYDPSFSGGVAAVAPDGVVVQITGRASDGFYPVDWDGLQGYMHGDYLSWTDEDLSERGGSGDGGSSDGGGDAVGSSSVVDFAMQYLGYPYVWATHGPSSFDCSGFTYWVLSNTLGVNIGTGTMSQIGYGTPVDRNSLQPGDLVFFQNTYTWGLSHVGIYIGGNQFIHAENESTGVVISDLDSSYYASRWYGARRVG
jgi:mannosyl-glycoprotein endo-beta-N-acetylglucosaminidase